jgi:hypothetical protein
VGTMIERSFEIKSLLLIADKTTKPNFITNHTFTAENNRNNTHVDASCCSIVTN